MENETLETFTLLSTTNAGADWKKSLESLFIVLRKIFVFDNIAIYLVENHSNTPEVIFARAVGRGRDKESEASWGEEIANQVIIKGESVESIPEKRPFADRITMPHLLGLPLPSTSHHSLPLYE